MKLSLLKRVEELHIAAVALHRLFERIRLGHLLLRRRAVNRGNQQQHRDEKQQRPAVGRIGAVRDFPKPQPENENQQRRNGKQQQPASEVEGKAGLLCVHRHAGNGQPAAAFLKRQADAAHVCAVERHGDGPVLREKLVKIVLDEFLPMRAGFQRNAHAADAVLRRRD